jgi:hypothetical protein
MQRRFAVLIFMMLSASSAWADWQLLKETREYILYIDPDTVQKNGGLVKAVSFQDFHKMQTLAEHAYLASKTLNEYDCAKKLLRQVELSIFPENMGSGGALFTDNKVQEWEPVQTGSAAETLWKSACGQN